MERKKLFLITSLLLIPFLFWTNTTLEHQAELEKNVGELLNKNIKDNEQHEEENKRLEEENKRLEEENKRIEEDNKQLEEENKQLKEDLEKNRKEKQLNDNTENNEENGQKLQSQLAKKEADLQNLTTILASSNQRLKDLVKTDSMLQRVIRAESSREFTYREWVNNYNSTFMSEMRVNLVCEFYIINTRTANETENNKAILRNDDILTALKANLLNPYINKIHLIIDEEAWNFDFNSSVPYPDKIVPIKTEKRWTIPDILRYSSENLTGTIVIFGNNDIYYEDSLRFLSVMWSNTSKWTYVLSRSATYSSPTFEFGNNTNDQDMCLDQYFGSEDAFIFKSPIQDKSVYSDLQDVTLGRVGAENAYVWAMENAGYKTLNPCGIIRIHHIHQLRSKHKDETRVKYLGSGQSKPIYSLKG